MENYWLPILSILISVVLSIIGYRRILGARRERTRLTNTELEKILIRRIVVESYQPNLDDLSRLINAKSRDNQVRREELLSETQLLENVFTRITESDFMTQDQRNMILQRLSPLYAKAEKALEEEIQEMELPASEKTKEARTTPFIIGFIASLTAVVITIIISLFSDSNMFPTTSIIFAFIGSLAAGIGIIFAAYRLRESPEDSSARSAIQSAIGFEQDITNLFNKMKIPLLIDSSFSGYDFIVNIGEKKILIEAKSWVRLPSISLLKRKIDRLSRAVQSQNAVEGIIVTKTSFKLPNDLIKDNRIRLMSLSELRNYISHSQ